MECQRNCTCLLSCFGVLNWRYPAILCTYQLCQLRPFDPHPHAVDSPDQRTGSPSVGSQPCSPLADAILITPQRSVYNAVYPSCRDHDQWGHDSSCHDSVCFTVLLVLGFSWHEYRFKHLTSIILFSIAVYSAVYGVSYAYLLHHLSNIFSAWLVCIYLSSSGFSLRRLWRILEGDEHSSSASEVGGSHVKKKPWRILCLHFNSIKFSFHLLFSCFKFSGLFYSTVPLVSISSLPVSTPHHHHCLYGVCTWIDLYRATDYTSLSCEWRFLFPDIAYSAVRCTSPCFAYSFCSRVFRSLGINIYCT